MQYFPVYKSYLEMIEPLGDAACGRLFTALLTYITTGTAPELRKKERFVFAIMRQHIDSEAENLGARHNPADESLAAQIEKCGSAKTEKSERAILYNHDSLPYKCAVYLNNELCARLNKKPYCENRLQGWAKHFDKLNREDGYSWEDIKAVLRFSQKDAFWQTIIKTARVFREQAPQIRESMQNHAST